MFLHPLKAVSIADVSVGWLDVATGTGNDDDVITGSGDDVI